MINKTRLKNCFVVCPIGDEDSNIRKRSDFLFYNVFKVAANRAGLEIKRSDLGLSENILPDIFERLNEDVLVIADISGEELPNPNVMYELGYRDALGLPSIVVRDPDNKIPFDIKDKRVITLVKPKPYEGIDPVVDKIYERIKYILRNYHLFEHAIQQKTYFIDSEAEGGLDRFYDFFQKQLRKTTDQVCLIGSGFDCIDERGRKRARKYLRVLTGCALRHQLERIEMANIGLTEWIDLVTKFLAPIPGVKLYTVNPLKLNMFTLKDIALLDPKLDTAMVQIMVPRPEIDPMHLGESFIAGPSLFVRSSKLALRLSDRILEHKKYDTLVAISAEGLREKYKLPPLKPYKNKFVNYFAYGSNLLEDQMKARMSYCKYIAMARLKGYELVFNNEGSLYDDAVANIKIGQNEVWGILYKVKVEELQERMDFYEGVDENEYERISVIVEDLDRNKYEAQTYINQMDREATLPSLQYIDRILRGAKERKLPESYILGIEKIRERVLSTV